MEGPRAGGEEGGGGVGGHPRQHSSPGATSPLFCVLESL